MRIRLKIVVPCWPSVDYAAQKCFRKSIEDLTEIAFDNILALVKDNKPITASIDNYDIQIVFKVTCYLSASRNNGVTDIYLKKQTVTDCDFVLFCDADTGFVFDNIVAMVEENKPVIGGAYRYRKERAIHIGTYCAGDFMPNKPGFIYSYIDARETGIIKCDWVGGGFVLVRADTFNKIEYPWFHCAVLEDGDYASEMGEDIGFCLKCHKAGVPIYLHCGFLPKLIHEQDLN
jgi:hypothetical protein